MNCKKFQQFAMEFDLIVSENDLICFSLKFNYSRTFVFILGLHLTDAARRTATFQKKIIKLLILFMNEWNKISVQKKFI